MKQEGFVDPLAQKVYELASSEAEWTVVETADRLATDVPAVEQAVARLLGLGLVRPAPTAASGYAAVAPEAALTRLFSQEDRQQARHLEQARQTRDAIAVVMQNFLDLRHSRQRTLRVQELATEQELTTFLEDAADLARSQVWTMHTGRVPSAEALDEMLLRQLALLGAGVAVRALHLHRHASDPLMSGHLLTLSHAGAEVRVAPHLPQRMVLVDRELVVLPVDPDDDASGALAVHGTELVPSLRAMHEHCWISATPLREHPVPSDHELLGSPAETVLVRLLAEGVKDDVIARRLGVSARTLSRMIAALLNRLGVQTRFQAALELQRRGYLDRASPVSRAA